MRKRIIAIASALIVAVGLAFVIPGTASATSIPGPRSGLLWISGAYLDHNPANITPYETGRGKKLDAIEVFPERSTQASMLDNWWLDAVRPVTNDNGWAIVTVPLWAQNQNVNTDTTTLFRTLGQQLTTAGIANRTLVRLGWEMNLPDQYWNVTTANRAKWVSNFQRATNLLRQYAPGVKIAFNPNEGASQTNLSNIGQLALDLKTYYEYVGPDFYNWYNQMDTQAQWNARYAGTYGMKYWEDFARTNGKGFTVPEWGGAPAVNNSTGVFYAQQMIGRFRSLSAEGISVIDAHFNEPASYIANSLWNPQQMPAMATAVRNALSPVASRPTSSSPRPTVR